MHGQNKVLTGKLMEAGTQAPLAAATIADLLQNTGTLSRNDGSFQLSSPTGVFQLAIQLSGYDADTLSLQIQADSSVRIFLHPNSVKVAGLTISDLRNSLEDNQMSFTSLSIERIKNLPVFMGEVDVLKTLQLLPGIQSGSEASSGLYVRGGGPDQNLMLLDDVPLYNVSHLFGFFSIFNGDVVEGVDLYKGAFPARYGGRLSSVVDVRPRKGDFTRWHATGGLGLIASRLTVEGPIVKEKLSVLLAARRTYVDIFTRQINRMNAEKEGYEDIPDYFFEDFNGRMDWKPSAKDHISLSGYMGRDQFNYVSGNYFLDFFWRNRTASLQWDHWLNSRAAFHTSATFNRFDYDIHNQYVTHEIKVYSDIRDFSGQWGLVMRPNDWSTYEAGANYTWHTFTPRGVSGEVNYANFDLDQKPVIQTHEVAAYISQDMRLTARTRLNTGLRLSGLAVRDTFMPVAEPRLSLLHRISENISLKASYTRMAQYVHLVSNSSITLPSDIWYPATPNAKPEVSDQWVLGINSILGEQWELNVEAFYKYNQNLVEYREGAQFLFSSNLEEDLTYGRGWVYGGEFFFQKRIGKWTGWAGYTLSWNFRQFDQLNRGRVYPSKYDRRHDISLVNTWQVSKKVNLGAVWVLGSGTAFTLPVGRYILGELDELDPEIIPQYSARNAYRMPTYHRLDLSCTWTPKPERGRSSIAFNIYNAYNRRNAFFIYFEEVTDPSGIVVKYQAKKVSLFPALPSIAWNFHF